jgi:hypothetical protein
MIGYVFLLLIGLYLLLMRDSREANWRRLQRETYYYPPLSGFAVALLVTTVLGLLIFWPRIQAHIAENKFEGNGDFSEKSGNVRETTTATLKVSSKVKSP